MSFQLGHASPLAPEAGEFDPADWSGCETEVEHELAFEDEARPIPAEAEAACPGGWNLETARSRAASMLAALVPLLLAADLAHAAPPEPAPPEPAPPEPAIEPEATSAKVEGPKPSPEAVWRALVDRRIGVQTKDATVIGTLIGVEEGVLIIVRESDGSVVLVEQQAVTKLRVAAKTNNVQTQKGSGLITFGTIATAIGTGLMVGAGVTVGLCMQDEGYYYSGGWCPWMTLPLAVVGVVNLGMGIPLTVTGVRKRREFEKSSGAELLPVVGATRDGGSVGVSIRF